MADMTDLLKAIKRASREASEASGPSDFVFGKVISTDPLQIQVDQKLILTKAQLVLTRSVTDFDTKVTLKKSDGWKTEERAGGSLAEAFASHDHDIELNEVKIKIHNALKSGEEVILLKKKGGQKYLVVDRIG